VGLGRSGVSGHTRRRSRKHACSFTETPNASGTEERRTAYFMLGLRVEALPDGVPKAEGTFEEEIRVGW
jgi:hypothetical protein